MSTQFTTKNVPDYEASETIEVVRLGVPNADGSVNQTTIYSGPADVQFYTGDTFVDPAGTVVDVDAIAVISDFTTMPAVIASDVLQVNGETLRVVLVSPWNYPPGVPHLELKCKIGAGKYVGTQ